MTKQKSVNPALGKMVVHAANGKRPGESTVRFGSVEVKSVSPRNVELRRNVSSGQLALARASNKISKAGVSLRKSDSVPLYHADPRVPGRVVRELKGKVTAGVFVSGKFKPLPKA